MADDSGASSLTTRPRLPRRRSHPHVLRLDGRAGASPIEATPRAADDDDASSSSDDDGGAAAAAAAAGAAPQHGGNARRRRRRRERAPFSAASSASSTATTRAGAGAAAVWPAANLGAVAAPAAQPLAAAAGSV